MESLSASESEVLEKFYNRVRAQVEHENTIYNQRMTWLITIQSLLYATTGILIKATSETLDPNNLEKTYAFIFLVCLLGFFVSIMSAQILKLNRLTLNELRDLWTNERSKIPEFEKYKHLFPHSSGGILEKPRAKRLFRSGNLPYLFAISWVLSASILLGDFVPPVLRGLGAALLRI